MSKISPEILYPVPITSALRLPAALVEEAAAVVVVVAVQLLSDDLPAAEQPVHQPWDK
jgi:hypothetical protein